MLLGGYQLITSTSISRSCNQSFHAHIITDTKRLPVLLPAVTTRTQLTHTGAEPGTPFTAWLTPPPFFPLPHKRVNWHALTKGQRDHATRAMPRCSL